MFSAALRPSIISSLRNPKGIIIEAIILQCVDFHIGNPRLVATQSLALSSPMASD